MPNRILDNLRQVSRDLESEKPVYEEGMRQLLEETSCMSEELFSSLRSRIHDIAEDLRDARGMFKRVDSLFERVTTLVGERLGEPMTEDSRGRDSGDSEATAVSERDSSLPLSKQTDSESIVALPSVPVIIEPQATEGYVSAGFGVSEVADADPLHLTADPIHEEGRLMKFISPWIKDLPRKKSKGDLKSGVADTSKLATALSSELDKKDLTVHGTAKLRSWFLRKLRSDDLQSAAGAQVATSAVTITPGAAIAHANGKPARERSSPSTRPKMCAAARRVISIASKDLSRIDDSMDTVSSQ